MGWACVHQRRASIITQSAVRNHGIRWRQGLEIGSKSKANWWKTKQNKTKKQKQTNKKKSKLMGAEKIHVGDGREACDLNLSASMSACDVPSTLSVRPSAGIRTESWRRDWTGQGVRSSSPRPSAASLSDTHTHTHPWTQIVCSFSQSTTSSLFPVHMLPLSLRDPGPPSCGWLKSHFLSQP